MIKDARPTLLICDDIEDDDPAMSSAMHDKLLMYYLRRIRMSNPIDKYEHGLQCHHMTSAPVPIRCTVTCTWDMMCNQFGVLACDIWFCPYHAEQYFAEIAVWDATQQ